MNRSQEIQTSSFDRSMTLGKKKFKKGKTSQRKKTHMFRNKRQRVAFIQEGQIQYYKGDIVLVKAYGDDNHWPAKITNKKIYVADKNNSRKSVYKAVSQLNTSYIKNHQDESEDYIPSNSKAQKSQQKRDKSIQSHSTEQESSSVITVYRVRYYDFQLIADVKADMIKPYTTAQIKKLRALKIDKLNKALDKAQIDKRNKESQQRLEKDDELIYNNNHQLSNSFSSKIAEKVILLKGIKTTKKQQKTQKTVMKQAASSQNHHGTSTKSKDNQKNHIEQQQLQLDVFSQQQQKQHKQKQQQCQTQSAKKNIKKIKVGSRSQTNSSYDFSSSFEHEQTSQNINQKSLPSSCCFIINDNHPSAAKYASKSQPQPESQSFPFQKHPIKEQSQQQEKQYVQQLNQLNQTKNNHNQTTINEKDSNKNKNYKDSIEDALKKLKQIKHKLKNYSSSTTMAPLSFSFNIDSNNQTNLNVNKNVASKNYSQVTADTETPTTTAATTTSTTFIKRQYNEIEEEEEGEGGKGKGKERKNKQKENDKSTPKPKATQTETNQQHNDPIISQVQSSLIKHNKYTVVGILSDLLDDMLTVVLGQSLSVNSLSRKERQGIYTLYAIIHPQARVVPDQDIKSTKCLQKMVNIILACEAKKMFAFNEKALPLAQKNNSLSSLSDTDLLYRIFNIISTKIRDIDLANRLSIHSYNAQILTTQQQRLFLSLEDLQHPKNITNYTEFFKGSKTGNAKMSRKKAKQLSVSSRNNEQTTTTNTKQEFTQTVLSSENKSILEIDQMNKVSLSVL